MARGVPASCSAAATRKTWGEEEEHAHECLSLFMQRFEAVDSVILTPQVMEQPDKTFDSIRIFLQKRVLRYNT